VDDGTDRADQIMTNPRAQERGEIESADCEWSGRTGGHKTSAGTVTTVRVTAHVIRQSCPGLERAKPHRPTRQARPARTCELKGPCPWPSVILPPARSLSTM